jgi:hypothetical protein
VEDPVLKDPVQPLNASIQPEITSLQMQTSVWNAVTVESDQQTIFIDANDQSGNTLNKAAGNAIIDTPSETAQTVGAVTNNSVSTFLHISFADKPPRNPIHIEVHCQYQESVSGHTITSFRIWY